jgi:hypothetical protein
MTDINGSAPAVPSRERIPGRVCVTIGAALTINASRR